MKKHPNAKVLEFGSGSSTIWFAKNTKNLTSVEHSPKWFTKIKELLTSNDECQKVNLILHDRPYYTICNQFPDNYFDLILVDGRNRNGCIKHSIRILKPGGTLMLDNAERPYYQKSLNLLKNWQAFSADQPQPDTCGFTYPGWKTNWYIKPT
ncbi:MAG: class I SAM-dependent methyltransferase [Candidatus Paceibacterota bacterium]